jgi:translation initiation factor 2 subunit 2
MNIQVIEEDIEDIDLCQFNLSKKKKKKKKDNEDIKNDDKKKYENKDYNEEDEYDYITLLERAFSMIREKNPNLVSRKKQIIPAPILHKLGSKKTMWSNFSNTVSVLNRGMDHIQSYISYEMSTDCSIDGNYRLIIKGKFSSKNLEPVLTKYIIEYVSCHMCRGHDTYLIKDPITRLTFLKCDMCKSTRSVEPIKKRHIY